MKVIKRKVFLDDTANEADIRRQFNRAVELARRNGSAIAIGHPRPATVKVLQQMLPSLPADIVLVKPSALLNEPQGNGGGYVPPPVKPQNRSRRTRSAAASSSARSNRRRKKPTPAPRWASSPTASPPRRR